MDVPTLVAVKALSRYRLWLRYADGAEGGVDVSHLAGKGVFKYWAGDNNFQKVHVSEAGAVAWTDDIEICPDSLYLRLTGKSAEDFFPSTQTASGHV